MMHFAKTCAIVNYVYFLVKQDPAKIYIMRGTTMKKTLKPILSLLLAFAMLLPMAGVANAAVTGITLSISPSNTLYYRPYSVSQPSATLSATITDDSGTAYAGSVVWDAAASPYVTITPNAANSSTAAITATSLAPAATSSVIVSATAGGMTQSLGQPVNVLTDAATSLSFTYPAVGSTQQLTLGTPLTTSANVTYQSGAVEAANMSALTYSASPAGIVSVSSAGVITPLTTGTATITASAGTSIGAPSTTFTVVVGSGVNNNTGISVSGSAYMSGSNYYYLNLPGQYNTTGTSIYQQLSAAFTSVYGVAPNTSGNTATILLTPAAASSYYGTLSGNAYPNINLFTDVASMYFIPAGVGTYECSFVLTDGVIPGTATPRAISGVIRITVSSQSTNIYIPVPSSAYSYTFSGATANGSAATSLIAAALGTSASSVSYIVFNAGASSTNASGRSVGTLYTSYQTMTAVAGGNTAQTVNYANIGEMYFQPTGNTGTYSIGYTAYSANNVALCTGTMYLLVNSGTLDVSLTLNSEANYTFSSPSSTVSGGTGSSAYTLITSAIAGYGLTGSNYYLSFDVPSMSSASAAVGTLYRSSNLREVYSTDRLSYSELSGLYFTPKQAGTYAVTYYVYNTSTDTNPLGSGTLSITVASVLGEANFSYATTYGKTVALNEKDFADFVQKKLGAGYTLSHIVFNNYSGSGTFYYDSNKFAPYNTSNYYSRSYSGADAATVRYIDTVRFTAPSSSAGYTAVSFTAYASLLGGAAATPAPGVFHIYYTAAEVPVITYDASSTSGITLRESDFISAYKTAMGSTASSNPQFRVCFQSVPSNGFLYQGSTSSSRGNTQLTSVNVSSTYYTVGSTSSARSVSTLSYTPFVYNSTMDKVTYIAYSTNNVQLYSGEVVFRAIAPRTATVASDGLDFSSSDFYSTSDSDPVTYVTFKTPVSGKFFVQQNGRLIAANENTKFYTLLPTDGTYPVSAAHYIPRVAQTAPITLTYVAHLKSGASYENTISVTPTSKTSSASFYDVTGNVGSWSANSVDFATKFGLVKGVGNGQFNPNSTMNRGDLVLILYRMAGSPAVSGTAPFSEFPITANYSASYKQEINNSALWAYNSRLLDGVTDGTSYRPFQPITRQDYATILYNYNKNIVNGSVSNSGSIERFVDKDQVASYALAAMQWAVGNNYMNGTSTDPSRPMLSPASSTTRAEIVTLLHRYLTY